MKNPYTWSQVNLDLVYGRSKLTNELLNGLPGIPPISYAITGGRRIGKSTVLRLVEHDLRSSAEQWAAQDVIVAPIYVDGLALARPVDAGRLWGQLFAEILAAQVPGSSAAHAAPLLFEDFVTRTRELLAASQKATRVIVLFDEIEPVLAEEWSDGYFSNWRALLSNSPGLSSHLSAVFCGAQELVRLRQDVGSPLMDILELRSLGNLARDDAIRLMKEPVGIDWDQAFCDYIYAQSGGHPMLLQYLMQAVCNKPADITPLEAASQARDSFLANRSWQFSDWWYKHCSPLSQAVYRRLPDNFSWISLKDLVQEYGSREANDAVDLLLHVGIAQADNEGLAFKRAGEMFAGWQKINGKPSPTASRDPEIYRRLAKLRTEFADKYSSAWSILGTDLPNYSGAVGEMRDTVTLVLHELAPDKDVMASESFELEKNEKAPTRRQRARYVAAKQLRSSEFGKALANDIEALEFQYALLEKSVTSAYGIASSLTHTTSTRDLAYRSLKQGESILAQLLQA